MILTHAIALLAVCTCPAQDAPDAKTLVEKMLARYHAAKTLTGTIKLTVSTKEGSAALDTTLQYERPNKLYIFQRKRVANPDPESPSQWLVTSDGTMFSYNVPNDRFHAAPTLRLVEPVNNQRVKLEHDLASIYSAASKSIGDRSMPLDVAVAGKEDLLYRAGQWASRQLQGTKEIAGKTAYLVGGNFRPYNGAEVIGKYQMAITADGELLNYIEEQYIGVEGRPDPVRIVSTWEVQLQIDGQVNQALFKVVVR